MAITTLILIIVILIAVIFIIRIISKVIAKNKAEGKSNKKIYIAIISVILIIALTPSTIIFIQRQIAINRIVGEWRAMGETLEFQRRDRRMYANNSFAGNWSLNRSRLTFYFLDNTTETVSVQFENNNNWLVIIERIDGIQYRTTFNRRN